MKCLLFRNRHGPENCLKSAALVLSFMKLYTWALYIQDKMMANKHPCKEELLRRKISYLLRQCHRLLHGHALLFECNIVEEQTDCVVQWISAWSTGTCSPEQCSLVLHGQTGVNSPVSRRLAKDLSRTRKARALGLPPKTMSVPRPAILVAIVTALGRPAWAMIWDSFRTFSGLALSILRCLRGTE